MVADQIPPDRSGLVSQATPLSPHRHPILHPDILPLILSFAPDRTLARLMRVNRHVLAEIVNLRWPVVTYDPSNRQPVILSRTFLPEHSHRFSAPMQILLTHYARMVFLLPHPAYTCPPRIIRNLPPPLAKTVRIDARGLCRSVQSTSWLTPGDAEYSAPLPCQLLQDFRPSTLRIDGIHQHPRFPLPHGLTFAPSVTRVLLCIEPKLYAPSFPTTSPYFAYTLPHHVKEVVFLLAQPTTLREHPPPKKDPRVSLATLADAIAGSLFEDTGGEARRWTVVGAEVFGRPWLPKSEEGVEQEDSLAAIRRGIINKVEKQGIGLGWMDKVEFVTLQAYLRGSQTRSELTAEEISVMAAAEKKRLAQVKKRAAKRMEGC